MSVLTGAAQCLRNVKPSAGFVYLIQVGKLTKIGHSNNPARRIRNMQLPGEPIVFWYPSHDAKGLESLLHNHYAKVREHGEWFRLTEEQYTDAQRAMREYI